MTTQNNIPMSLVMMIRKDVLEMKKIDEGRMIHKRMMTKKHLKLIKCITITWALSGGTLKRALNQGIGGGLNHFDWEEEDFMYNECCLCEENIKGREVWEAPYTWSAKNASAYCFECAVEVDAIVDRETGLKYDEDDTWVGQNMKVDKETGLLLYIKDHNRINPN